MWLTMEIYKWNKSEMQHGTNMSESKSTNPAVQKSGQTGGRESGGCSDKVSGWIFFAVAKIITSRIEDSKYTPFWLAKNFVGWENDLQSWNPCFLGVRSPVWLFEVRRGPCLVVDGNAFRLLLHAAWSDSSRRLWNAIESLTCSENQKIKIETLTCSENWENPSGRGCSHETSVPT